MYNNPLQLTQSTATVVVKVICSLHFQRSAQLSGALAFMARTNGNYSKLSIAHGIH